MYELSAKNDRLTSLRKTMKFIFRSIYGLTPSQVLSPSDITKKKYDILLVDEAHRLHQYKNISYRGAFKKSCERLGMTTDADDKYKGYDIIAVDTSQERLDRALSRYGIVCEAANGVDMNIYRCRIYMEKDQSRKI